MTPRPYTLVAELTYRCPLRCAYCSNPVDWAGHPATLDAEGWLDVFRQAEALGVVHVNLTGGEPLLRADLEALIAGARRLDLYTHLVTSGIPLGPARVAGLRAAGLDSVQLSIQDVDAAAAHRITGRHVLPRKLDVARALTAAGFPLTLNVVLHRDNIERLPEMVALAETLGAERLELANVQYLGWALHNRAALLPTAAQIARAREQAAAAAARLRGTIEVAFVLPDYYAEFPKPCMDGWGRRFVVVSPDGHVLPCQAAHSIPALSFETVAERPLADIWRDSPAFNAFRGEDWMREPCRSCARRGRDFGGCRCQAYHLTGDAAATDPACALSPAHAVVEAARSAAVAPAALRAAHGA